MCIYNICYNLMREVNLMSRRNVGRETWNRLLNWEIGQASSERLASLILRSEGYESINPSHPLGGKDGGKDILCKKDDIKLLGAVYFPRGQQKFNSIKTKFLADLKGVEKNNVNGIVFITNQELKLSERKILTDINKEIFVEIYHLERISNLLDSPINYGIRLEFLDIEFTKEELLSYQALKDKEYYERNEIIYKKVTEITNKLDKAVNNLISWTTGGNSFGYVYYWNSYSDGIGDFRFVCRGDYPLFNVYIKFAELRNYAHTGSDHDEYINEINNDKKLNYKVNLQGQTEKRYEIYIRARNGIFIEILKLYKIDEKVYSGIRVYKNNPKDECIIYETIDKEIKDILNQDWE